MVPTLRGTTSKNQIFFHINNEIEALDEVYDFEVHRAAVFTFHKLPMSAGGAEPSAREAEDGGRLAAGAARRGGTR